MSYEPKMPQESLKTVGVFQNKETHYTVKVFDMTDKDVYYWEMGVPTRMNKVAFLKNYSAQKE